MLKKLTVAACMLSLAAGVAFAGAPAPKAAAMAGADKMAMMKAEMMKCSTCKHMAMHLDELGPMTMDVAQLNDGVAIMHGVTNPAKAVAFHAACKETEAAGMASMSMTDDQAKTDLCSMCQDMRSAMKAGAKMSVGETTNGGIMVMTSSDPVVQKSLAGLAAKCAMMAKM